MFVRGGRKGRKQMVGCLLSHTVVICSSDTALKRVRQVIIAQKGACQLLSCEELLTFWERLSSRRNIARPFFLASSGGKAIDDRVSFPFLAIFRRLNFRASRSTTGEIFGLSDEKQSKVREIQKISKFLVTFSQQDHIEGSFLVLSSYA